MSFDAVCYSQHSQRKDLHTKLLLWIQYHGKRDFGLIETSCIQDSSVFLIFSDIAATILMEMAADNFDVFYDLNQWPDKRLAVVMLSH